MRFVSRGNNRRSRGQSVTEFALVVPLLLLLLFGTIQVGITYGGYNGLINAVREAARYGSVCSGNIANCGPSTATHLTEGIVGGVFGYKSGSPNPPTAIVAYSTYNTQNLADPLSKPSWNIRITVTGCARGIVFIPFVGNVLGWTDATGVPLKSTEVFRVEGQPTATEPTLPSPSTFASPSGGTCP